MSKGSYYVEKGFFDLFWDAAWFARRILKKKKEFDDENESRFARASIISAALSVECAANCCIEELSGKFRDDVDKLPILSKFDVYLLSKRRPILDRGSRFVQPVSELIGLRNEYVHRKVTKVACEYQKIGQFGTLKMAPSKFTNSLGGFNTDSRVWGNEAAFAVLGAVTKFFDYYFLERCKHSPQQVRQILYGGAVGVKEIKKSYTPWMPREILKLQREKIITLKFITG